MSVRSGARNRSANARLFRPAPSASDRNTSNSRTSSRTLAGGAAQRLGHVSGRDVLVHDEREVDRRRRVRGRRPERAIPATAVEQPIEIQLEPDDRRRELERDEQTRVELPHDADLLAVDEDGGGAGGIEAGPGRRFGPTGGDLERVEDLVQHVERVEGVDRAVGLDRPPAAPCPPAPAAR